MKDIAIFGAGGFGKEVKTVIDHINAIKKQWNLIGFFDDNVPQGELVSGLPILGGIDHLNQYEHELALVVALGFSSVRTSVTGKINNSKLSFPVLIHPQALIGDTARVKFGKGTIITAGVIITTDIHIGEFVVINLNATIGHDTDLGDFVSLMPGVNIAGNVTLHTGVFVGSGANVLNNLNIGEFTLISAGSLVNRDLPPRCKAAGMPARIINDTK